MGKNYIKNKRFSFPVLCSNKSVYQAPQHLLALKYFTGERWAYILKCLAKLQSYRPHLKKE